MPEQKDDTSKAFAPPIAAVALIVASLFLHSQAPLKGDRPPETDKSKYRSLAEQNVDARLWQDPFAAMERYREENEKPPIKNESCAEFELQNPQDKSDAHSMECLAGQINEKSKTKKVAILGVMVGGEPYKEDQERRRRTRYAVVSGLSAAGYTPANAEHIGYFKPVDLEEIGQEAVPYEWFAGKVDNHVPVLVLWLDDSAFSARGKPLSALSALVKVMQDKGMSVEQDLSIVGPARSATLVEMLRELKNDKFKNTYLQNVKFYSTRATAEDSLLLKESGIVDFTSVEDVFSHSNIPFLRTIGTDRDMAAAIASELKKRQIDPNEKNSKQDHIALISELDTFYGRSLPKTFINYYGSEEKYFHEFRYLRGLDGRTAEESTSKSSASGRKDGQGNKSTVGESYLIEKAEGEGQRDYLRRLAERISRLDRKFQRDNDGRITAIGVLGSDVYDKLLILQALREYFPGVVYFTTDMDARLLHPSQFDWARNLIVASGFGLELDHKLQGEIPPFRDSYQTSVFFAIMTALSIPEAVNNTLKDGRKAEKDSKKDAEEFSKLLIKDGKDKRLPPRLYEIGRTRAFDLSEDNDTGNENNDGGCSYENLWNCVRIHPTSIELSTTNMVWLARLLGGTIFLWVCGLIWSLGKERKIIFLLLWCCVALGAIMLAMLAHIGDEPLAFTEGVSIWPSQFIRFCAGLLSVCFVYLSWEKIKKSDEEIKPINSVERGDKKTNKPRLTEELGFPFPWKKDVSIFLWKGASGSSIKAEELLDEYHKRSHWWYRFSRSLWQFIIFFIFAISLFSFFRLPNVPARGEANFLFNERVLIFSVILFIFLVSFVGDAMKLCCRFITLLSGHSSDWSDERIQLFKRSINTTLCLNECDHQKKKEKNPEECDKEFTRVFLNEWIDVKIIAERTEVIGKLISYPFIILFLMIIARSPLFDNWDMPQSLIIIYGVYLTYILGYAFFLRRVSERARNESIYRLKNELEKEVNSNRRNQIKETLKAIESFKEGAFGSFWNAPAFHALLIPSGGAGGLFLIEYLIRQYM